MSASKLSTTKSCAGCKRQIKEKYLLFAVEKYWHTTCLKCSQCEAVLDQVGRSCFVKGTSILCRDDYMSLYRASRVCTGCAKQIPARGMVLRAGRNVYHVNCFVCTTCTRLLKTGDKYCIIDGKLFCEQDARATKQQEKPKQLQVAPHHP